MGMYDICRLRKFNQSCRLGGLELGPWRKFVYELRRMLSALETALMMLWRDIEWWPITRKANFQNVKRHTLQIL